MEGHMNPSPDFLQPDVQLDFARQMSEIRKRCLWEGLQSTLQRLKIPEVDEQLAKYASEEGLSKLAVSGLRGELVYPIPLILLASPSLLAYYRLLFGISQKEFFGKGGFGAFKRMEDRGELTPTSNSKIGELCKNLCLTADSLVLGLDDLSHSLVKDLQLLTLGAQLRGSRNTKIGALASQQVLELIAQIVGRAMTTRNDRGLEFKNAAGRQVRVEFASDPDVKVTELSGDTTRLILSIEIKGGADKSNIHNRLGEAEKSHLKAKQAGCAELWTLIRVPLDDQSARRGSPTTTRFFHLDLVLQSKTAEHKAFRSALIMHLGLK